MSRILITGGPTNEYIDEVMKITNMSTGMLSVTLAEYFLNHGDQICLVLNHRVNVDNLLAMPHSLLDSVSKEELFSVAAKLCEKNDMDYILANDLVELRNGMPARYLVTKDGFTGTKLETPKNIYKFINQLIG